VVYFFYTKFASLDILFANNQRPTSHLQGGGIRVSAATVSQHNKKTLYQQRWQQQRQNGNNGRRTGAAEWGGGPLTCVLTCNFNVTNQKCKGRGQGGEKEAEL